MRNWLREHYGHLYGTLGAAHIAVGIVQFRHEWGVLLGDGFINGIDERGAPYQGLGYWYIILGPVLIAIGVLAQAHLEATGTLPRAFSWIVALTSFAAGLAMPLNGIWLVGVAGLLGLRFAAPARPDVKPVPSVGPERPPRRVFEV